MPNYDRLNVTNQKDMIEQLRIIKELLNRLLHLLVPGSDKLIIEFYTEINGELKKVEHMFLKATEKLPLSLVIKDAAGNSARVDGAPRWAVTDEAAGRLEVAEDGMSATLFPLGPAAAFKVQAFVDADLGEGVKELLGELDVEVVSGEAVSVEIAAGNPEPL